MGLLQHWTCTRTQSASEVSPIAFGCPLVCTTRKVSQVRPKNLWKCDFLYEKNRLWANRVLGGSGVFARAARRATSRLWANPLLGGSGVLARAARPCAARHPGYGRTGYWADPGFLRAPRDFPVIGEPGIGWIRGFCARRATSRLWANRVLGGSGVFARAARRATSRLWANRVLGGSGVLARAGAVREWCSKLREVIDLPPSSGGDDGWVLGRLLVLVLRMWRHSSELGIPHPGVHIGQFFVQLTRDAWLIWLRDSTSPKLIVVPLTTAILERGVGPVGNVRIPPDIWTALVPRNFGEVSRRSFSSLASVTGKSAVLARALVQQGVLRPCLADGLGPNGSFFAIPKNSEKASCICNMVLFNKAQGCDSPPLRLPSVELVAFLQIVHRNIHLDFVPAGCARVVGDNVNFLLHQMASLKADPPCVGEEPVLCACHIDLSNCFWSLKTPVEFTDAFRVSVDGILYRFDCLPFGWTHSPAICQAVMVRLVQSAGVEGVLVLVYLDDVFVIGYGRKWVSMQAGVVASRLREEGAIVSPKSTLEAAVGLAWMGKFFDF